MNSSPSSWYIPFKGGASEDSTKIQGQTSDGNLVGSGDGESVG